MASNLSQTSADGLVEEELEKRLGALEKGLGGDVLVFVGPITYGADDEIRRALETLAGPHGTKRPKLIVLLETEGGYASVAERIADTFRSFYDRVEFVIPGHAFSAGTILACSGDAIWMDAYSVLGPIDPQIQQGDTWVPVLGYLAEYKRLIKKSRKGTLTTAELTLLVEKFDLAELHLFKQQKALSVTLLKKWLTNYKFRNWAETQTRKVPVTPEMREERAKEIANKLQETTRWHIHGRGISMQALREEVNLIIDDFGADQKLDSSIKCYYRLLKNYIAKVGLSAVLHVRGAIVPLSE